MLVNFIKSYHRFPYASGGDLEQSLQRWLYNIEHEAAISLEHKTVLSNTLQPYRDAHLPENSLEEDCAEMCEKIKEFIQREYELPTRQSNIELFEWLSRSKANYNSYIDNRRYYLTELFNYIHSLGFTL